MTKISLKHLLLDVRNRKISIDDAMARIDSELEITDDTLIYALYIDYNVEEEMRR